ncbi:TolC family protein [Candidatus Fermentibacteria bacterium]|nr:TolC family protein [Candidatus Fermentibacteria bacterium]
MRRSGRHIYQGLCGLDSPAALVLVGLLCAVVPARGEADRAVETQHRAPRGASLRLGVCDAILMALEHNQTVAISRLDPAITETYAAEHRAAFDPELSITAERSEAKTQRRLGSQPAPFDLEDEQFEGTVALSQTLPTGTSFTVSAGMTGSVSNLYTDQYTGTAGLTVTQSLLRGVGFGANLGRLRRARLDVAISEAELRGVAQQVAADVEQRYWDYYVAGQEVAIQAASLKLATQQLAESLERVRVGKLPELELAAVEAEVAARQSNLIDAESAHEKARLYLLNRLGPVAEAPWSLVIEQLDAPFTPDDTLDAVEAHEQVALRYRPDLEQARLALKKGDLAVAETANGLLPRLDLFLTLGRTTYAQSFEEAYPDLQSPYYQVSAGVALDFPVPNRAPSAQLRRARLSREQQSLAVANMERLVELDVRRAYLEVVRSRQQITATRLTRELQEKKLAAEVEKFRVGRATNFLVLQAQRDLTGSQLGEARAKVSYLTALVQLYVAEGTLLDRRGIADRGI